MPAWTAQGSGRSREKWMMLISKIAAGGPIRAVNEATKPPRMEIFAQVVRQHGVVSLFHALKSPAENIFGGQIASMSLFFRLLRTSEILVNSS